MSESKQADHWDLLASALGAEPQKQERSEPISQAEVKKPETEEDIIIDDIIEDIIKDADAKASAVEAEAEPAVPSEPVDQTASSAPQPPRISSWDALAMELGIEVKPAPPRPAAPPQAVTFRQVEKKAPAGYEREQEPTRPATAEFGENIRPFAESESESSEESQDRGDRKPRRRRRRHRRDKDKERPDADAERSAFESRGGAAVEEDISLSEISPETADKSGADPDESSKEESGREQSKHRRSRRGSRKHRRKGSEGDRESAADAAKSTFAGREDSESPGEMPQVLADDEEAADDDLEERGERGSKSAFRAIPTWEEAVGCIITKNMESRPRRQGNGPPRSRSGGDSRKRRRK